MVNCQRKKKSVLSNQTPKAQRVVEPSKNAKLMDIVNLDQAMEDHFKEDILSDIISRLPVQSLLRFKCVSKFWKTLIDEPYFRIKHLNHAKNDQNSQKFLFYQLCLEEGIFFIKCCSLSSVQLVENIRELDFPLNLEPQFCAVRCCCDGLFVITVYDNVIERYILLLWNPSTRESIILPAPEYSVGIFSCLGMSFDSSIGDYKILKIEENGNGGHNVPGEILTLKSGSWRKVGEHPSAIRNMVSGMHSLAFIHEAFHWVGISTSYFVISFNISNEVYGEILLPEHICLLNNIRIGVSIWEGMLCAYSNAYYEGNHTFTLWVMKDYGLKESWNAIFSIEDPYLCKAVPKYRFADGEVLLWCIHLKSGGNALRTKRGPFTLMSRGITQNGFTFTESLISPKLLT